MFILFQPKIFSICCSISYLPVGGQLPEDPKYTQRHLLLVYQQSKRVNIGKPDFQLQSIIFGVGVILHVTVIKI